MGSVQDRQKREKMGVTEALPPSGWGWGWWWCWLGSTVPGCTDPWEDVSSELQEGRGKEGRQRERISELALRMWLAEPGGASLTLGDKVQRKGGQVEGRSLGGEKRGQIQKGEKGKRERDWGWGERRDGDEQERGAKRKDEEKV